MKSFVSLKKITIATGILIFLVVILFPIGFIYLISDKDSLVSNNTVKVVDADTARNVRKLVKQIRKDILSEASSKNFSINDIELNQIIAVASRGSSRLKGRVNIAELGVYSVLSLYAPENPFGDYINLTFMVLPSTNGLQLTNVKLGKISLSGNSAKKIITLILNTIFDSDMGNKVLDAIQGVEIKNHSLIVKYRSIPDLNKQLEAFRERARYVRKELKLGGEPEHIKIYVEKLCQFDSAHNKKIKKSLALYIKSVFKLAHDRALIHPNPENEYRAALLALGIYFGPHQIETIVGPVKTGALKQCGASNNVVLAGRRDLMLHFIVSAVLKVLADSDITFAVGEFKELLDSGKGGSGFSFIDLAADRAGVKFAAYVLENSKSDRLDQLGDSAFVESMFFPVINDLPEEISKEEFEHYYDDINSSVYRSMLDNIDMRIHSLSLYN